MKTGIRLVSVLQATAQGLTFEGCSVGIDASTGGSGMLNLIDSTATNTSVLVAAAAASNSTSGSLVLENVNVDGSVPAVSYKSLLYNYAWMKQEGVNEKKESAKKTTK